MTDSALLSAYIDNGSQEAFRQLVEQYAPLVYSSCRRALGDWNHLTDDAVQTVFIVLTQKASGIKRRDALAAWLHRTSCYVTAGLKKQTFRRLERETNAMKNQELTEKPSDSGRLETQAHLDEALNSLSRNLREAVIAVYLHNRDRGDVAEELGCSETTLRKRLERGLTQLRRRLKSKGITVTGAVLLAGFSAEAGNTTPPALVDICKNLSASSAVADAVVSTIAQKTAQGVIKMMKINAMKTLLVRVSAVILLAVAGIVGFNRLQADEKEKPIITSPEPQPGRQIAKTEPKNDPQINKAENLPKKTAVAKEDLESVVEGNSHFAWDLYAQLKKEDGNLFFSPFSISSALAMTYAGARGNTEVEMKKVMHFGLEQKKLHPAFGNLIVDLNTGGKKGGYQLNVANALWGQKDYKFLDDFINLNKQSYGAGLKLVDYKNKDNREKARLAINGGVEDKTQDKIKNLIAKDVLNRLTRLVLVNAIYFKGDWDLQFDKKTTCDLPFHLSAGNKVNVPMMRHHEKEFKYIDIDGAQILEMPYKNKALSMLVFLPDKKDGLAEFEKRLTAQAVDNWSRQMHKQKVTIFFPKFKVEAEFQLKKQLKAMGMVDAFTPPPPRGKADFSRMTPKRELYISNVIHKAFVKVNEEGTEAAAATAVVIKPQCVGPKIPLFRADHPFIFMIRDNTSGSILFIGRVNDPR